MKFFNFDFCILSFEFSSCYTFPMGNFNPDIFKAYDIRGVYGKDFDDSFAYRLGRAFGLMRQRETKRDTLRIVVGRDMRVSSPALHRELAKGLRDQGMHVVDIGLAATPTFYFAVAHYGCDGGVLVSASHNPPEYNGFKLIRNRAIMVSKDSGIFLLRDLVLKGEFPAVDRRGSVTAREGVVSEQVDRDIAFANLPSIKKFKIVIDTANSMGALLFDELFSRLNCEIVKMNWRLSAQPSHEPNPYKKENMRDLCVRVVKENADFGIAMDGDADRIFFSAETGEALEPNVVRAMLCELFLRDHPGAKIGYDIRPGKITPDTIIAHGGIPVATRVGHSLIKEQMLRENIVFAGESSGHFFLNMDEGCYEIPIVVTLKILEELSKIGKKLSEYARPFKKYHNSGEVNFTVANAQSKIAELKVRYADGEQNELDGLSVAYDNWWFNVRPSNTEPLLRLIVEAKTKEMMETKVQELSVFISAPPLLRGA